MRVLRLVPIIVLSLLLGGLVLPRTGHATHTKPCCMCGPNTCKPTCTCRGTHYHCPLCYTDDSDSFQDTAVTGRSMLGISAVREPLASTVISSNVTERVMELIRGGKRVLSNFNLKLLANIHHSLQFGCPGSDEANIEDNMLAFNLR